MIIPDTPKSPVEDSTPLLGEAVDNGPNAPPAYTPLPRAAPMPIWDTQIPYGVYQSVHTQQDRQRTRKSAGLRFCMAFLVAFGVWLLVLALFGSLTAQSRLHLIQSPWEDYDYPIPSGVEPSSCAATWPEVKNPDFSDFPYSGSVSFDFDLPSKALLLLSQGGLSNGHLTITSSPDVANVQVVVTVSYHKAAVCDAAKVCFIERLEGENGVGIFTPQPWPGRTYTDRLFFDVKLVLPRSDSILHVNALSTEVQNFSHDVDTIDAYFNDLSLKASNGKIQVKSLTAAQVVLITSNAAITVESLIAAQAVLNTSNAPVGIGSLVAPIASVVSSNGRIVGAFAVADSLELKTINAAIDAVVSITGDSSLQKKNISLSTINSPLSYSIDLGPTKAEAGSFRVMADTSNGRMTGQIVSAPLNSNLTIRARTTNHEASLTLPSTYEGNFAISTSNAAARIARANPQEKDPACGSDAKCKGRSRTVNTTFVTKFDVQRVLHWDPRNVEHGKVVLSSTNGAATLYI
ncbi:hypothetical protein MSAN_01654000 [Mycena sanguinolenta]|uniref:DUF7330 domain-containing protein n=1 Tax=Mycena sanguinolenta TaxID=230812 RepID=A0A8H7CUH1_9AGAR|nr:hypothetical protein MSAN_01654000 [Mycena sanguinolenta]